MRTRTIIGMILAGVVIVGGSGYFAFFTKSTQEQAMDEAVTRMSAGLHQKVGFAAFSQLLLDLNTKYELARPKMRGEKLAEVDRLVKRLNDSHEIWLAGADKKCPQQCKFKLAPLFIDLEMIKDIADYDEYIEGRSMNELFNSGLNSTYIDILFFRNHYE